MSLILRAQVATAGHDVVPAWPLDSFIAVNPLAGQESDRFGNTTSSDTTTVRSAASYLADIQRGRITSADLDAAILERIPELGDERLLIVCHRLVIRGGAAQGTSAEDRRPQRDREQHRATEEILVAHSFSSR